MRPVYKVAGPNLLQYSTIPFKDINYLDVSSFVHPTMNSSVGPKFGVMKPEVHEVIISRSVIPCYTMTIIRKHQKTSRDPEVWSLGCCLYEMCMLKHAFSADNLLGSGGLGGLWGGRWPQEFHPPWEQMEHGNWKRRSRS